MLWDKKNKSKLHTPIIWGFGFHIRIYEKETILDNKNI